MVFFGSIRGIRMSIERPFFLLRSLGFRGVLRAPLGLPAESGANRR
jgi:hypothetical protein